MLNFVIPVAPITKKNSQDIIPIKNKLTGKVRHIPIPSKQYRNFEAECIPHCSGMGNFDYPVNVKAVFFMKTLRKVDLTNLLSALDDTLVKGGVLKDDNRDIIAGHDGSRVFYDKLNPRIEVTITPEKDYPQWAATQLEMSFEK